MPFVVEPSRVDKAEDSRWLWMRSLRAEFSDDWSDGFSKLVTEAHRLSLASIEDALEDNSPGELIESIRWNDIAEGLTESWLPVLEKTLERGGNAESVRFRQQAEKSLIEKQEGEVVPSFNLRSLFAQEWLSAHGAQLVTNVVDGTSIGIRQAVFEGFTKGRDIRKTARVIRPSLGLTKKGTQAVMNFFDGQLRSGVDVDTAVHRSVAYSEKLLNKRALTIAQTETVTAANEGQRQMWNQFQKANLLDAEQQREWIASVGRRTCTICWGLDGQKTGIDEPWISEEVGPVMNPGIGAHAGCRCTQALVID